MSIEAEAVERAALEALHAAAPENLRESLGLRCEQVGTVPVQHSRAQGVDLSEFDRFRRQAAGYFDDLIELLERCSSSECGAVAIKVSNMPIARSKRDRDSL